MKSDKKPKGRKTKVETTPCDTTPHQCPIVAIGASAGGLEVFQQFFDLMPAESGMAFLLVQHLDPRHETLMPELLSKHTQMTVLRVEDGLKVHSNHVYVIPPNTNLELTNCTFRTLPLTQLGERRLIDQVFRSLAGDQRENVVGIVLSGAGVDGSLGLRAIKENGGMTMAQSPDTAKFDSMPRHAISSGFVDAVLPVSEMPKRIVEYVQHLQKIHHRKGAESVQQEALAHLTKIFPILRKQTGHDFSRYKQSTVVRRIQRRMQVVYLDSVSKYVEYLRATPTEVDALFKDLLIGVTQFFRDAESFEALAEKAIAPLFAGPEHETKIRIWVPGCASGEEAYSFAILLAEEAQRSKGKFHLQVFATDLDSEALDFARKGRYPEDIAEQVSPERLARFFKKVGSAYEIIDEIREMCVFSPHNLIKDPPFSRLDLISCRNLLIYFEADLQKKLLPLFHYALNPCGYLFLGPSENVASRSELFQPVDPKHRIFKRKPSLLHTPVQVPLLDRGNVTRLQTLTAPVVTVPREQILVRSIERVILEEYAPANAVINEQGEVLYFSGNIGTFLEPALGVPSNKIVAMARKSLRLELRSLIHRAISTGREVTRENIRVKLGKEVRQIDIVVRPLVELGSEQSLYIVLFRELLPSANSGTPVTEDFASHEHPIIKQLESELQTTKEDLQTTIEELETSNEELKSANEELLSMNEELQSANEELQTSKEEVQSANDELHRKIEEADAAAMELRRAHDERAQFAAIVQNSEDAIISKSLDGTIKSWNRAAERIFGYTAAEIVGKNVTVIIPEERREEETHILARLRRGERIDHYETERLTKSGRRIQVSLTSSPIRDPEGFIVGAAKIARDITDRKTGEYAKTRLGLLVESSDDAIITKTLEGVITSWNHSAERIFGYTAEEAIGKSVTMLIPADRINEEPAIISRLRNGERIDHYETIRRRKDGTLIDISLTVSPIRDASGKIMGASKVARDITERKKAEAARNLLSAVVESTDDAIVTKTLDGIITTWNKAAERMFGYTAGEAVGKSITMLIPTDRLHEEPVIIDRLRRGLRIDHYETVRRRKDGTLFDVSLTVSPIRNASGTVIGASKIARDISEQKRVQAELERAKAELESRVKERTASLHETTEQLETFCYSIAHDLRSPLRAQQSFAQVLLDDYKSVLDENGIEYATRIINNAQRLDKLVVDLLAYSRLSREELKFEAVRLTKVITDVQLALAENIRRENACISVGPLHTVFAYEPTLHLVVLNLISNGIKFVAPGQSPELHIWSELRGDRIRLWIEDKGIGISPEHTSKIFGVFQRLHPIGKYPGTGIGLAIVQKGLERMGGVVGVESELGKGSRFWIELPDAGRLLESTPA